MTEQPAQVLDSLGGVKARLLAGDYKLAQLVNSEAPALVEHFCQDSEVVERLRDDDLLLTSLLMGFLPLDYQRGYFLDWYPRIIFRSNRQSGKTYTGGAKTIVFSIRNPGILDLTVSPALRQSMIYRDKTDIHLNRIPLPVRRSLFKLPLQRTVINYQNGSQNIFLPNSPDLVRGYTAHRVKVDEADMFKDAEYLFNNVLFHMMATTMKLGYGLLEVTSTPRGLGSYFHQICKEAGEEAKKPPEQRAKNAWKEYHSTYREPLRCGLIDEAYVEEMRRRLTPEQWKMEMEAEFADDSTSWLPYELCSRGIAADGPFSHFAAFEDSRQGIFVMGVDLGRDVDHSVVALFQLQGKVKHLVHLKVFPLGTPYASVIGYAKVLTDRFQRVTGIFVDATRETYVVEDMKRSILVPVTGIVFSEPSKQEMAGFLKQELTGGPAERGPDGREVWHPRVMYPYDADLINGLNVEQFLVKKDGKIGFTHPSGTHDDIFWAAALGVYGARSVVTEPVTFDRVKRKLWTWIPRLTFHVPPIVDRIPLSELALELSRPLSPRTPP